GHRGGRDLPALDPEHDARRRRGRLRRTVRDPAPGPGRALPGHTARTGRAGQEEVRQLMRRVLLASRNAGKVAELARMLEAEQIGGLEIVGLDQVAEFAEVPETGATFGENALLKARAAATATGMAVIADDSGLTVDALSGMPGVLSARWSGRHGDDVANTALLLAQLADVPEARRGAAFVSVCALVVPGAEGAYTETVVEGRWEGTIAREARAGGGCGPGRVFVRGGGDRTAAGVAPAEKGAASHRGRALRALLPELSALP